jgi:hypothetical protein
MSFGGGDAVEAKALSGPSDQMTFEHRKLADLLGLASPAEADRSTDWRPKSIQMKDIEMVERKGFEPSTPTLRTWCSPS